MGRVVVSEFVTVDGVMEDPGGAEAYEHGGWSVPYWDDAIGKFKFDELFASDALLLRRATYQAFAAAWPSMADEQGFADRMNGLPKHVVSATLTDLTWNNSHPIRGDLAAAVARLKQQLGGDILVGGSGQLVRTLIQHGPVDEYRLLVYPVVLGSGKRLFQDVTKAAMQLVETQAFGSGGVLLRYHPAT